MRKSESKLPQAIATVLVSAAIAGAIWHALGLPMVAIDYLTGDCVYVEPAQAGTCDNLPDSYSTFNVNSELIKSHLPD